MRFPGVALAIAAVAGLPAFAAGEPGATVWVPLTRVSKPAYPYDAIDTRLTGWVELTAVIQPSRFLRDIVYTTDRPESAIFVDAIKRVISDWELNPPLGLDCQPKTEPVRIRVTFQLEGIDPKVTVLGEEGTHSPYAGKAPRPMTHVNPRYPREAIERGWEANIYSLVEIGADGNVERVTARAYPRYHEPAQAMEAYTQQVVRALRQWKYPPAGAGTDSPRKACHDVNFRLR